MSNARSFLDKLDELRAVKGDAISLGDIADLAATEHLGAHGQLYSEIRAIADKIDSAKISIATDAETISGSKIPDANLELDAVIKATEEAANNIMDAAEAIQTIAGEAPTDIAQKLNEQVTNIFEASSFQDITGQRIRNVLNTLTDIEASITQLLAALEGKIDVNTTDTQNRDTRPDAHLMNGPQLKKDAPSQDDIDRLFAES